MFNRPIRAVLTLGCLVASAVQAEEQPENRVRTSRHLTEAILAGFRKGEPARVPTDQAPPIEVDAETLVLPTMEVRTARGAVALKEADLTPSTETIPLVAGTGVTEIKGPHRTILIRRILFIPVGFKLSW